MDEFNIAISFTIPYPAADNPFWFWYMLAGVVFMFIVIVKAATISRHALKTDQVCLRSLALMAALAVAWPCFLAAYVYNRWR